MDEYEKYCEEDYPKDADGEWVHAQRKGDKPGERFPDGTLIRRDLYSDHCSHPF